MDSLLLGTSTATLKKALIESQVKCSIYCLFYLNLLFSYQETCSAIFCSLTCPILSIISLMVTFHYYFTLKRNRTTYYQLGESVTGGGLSDELLQATYGVGLKGVKKENVDKVHFTQ